LIAGLVALIPTAAMAHSQLVLPLPWWISALGDGQSQCRLGYVGGTYFLKCEQVPAPTQAREWWWQEKPAGRQHGRRGGRYARADALEARL